MGGNCKMNTKGYDITCDVTPHPTATCKELGEAASMFIVDKYICSKGQITEKLTYLSKCRADIISWCKGTIMKEVGKECPDQSMYVTTDEYNFAMSQCTQVVNTWTPNQTVE
jgi:hypothetical protein